MSPGAPSAPAQVRYNQGPSATTVRRQMDASGGVEASADTQWNTEPDTHGSDRVKTHSQVTESEENAYVLQAQDMEQEVQADQVQEELRGAYREALCNGEIQERLVTTTQVGVHQMNCTDLTIYLASRGVKPQELSKIARDAVDGSTWMEMCGPDMMEETFTSYVRGTIMPVRARLLRDVRACSTVATAVTGAPEKMLPQDSASPIGMEQFTEAVCRVIRGKEPRNRQANKIASEMGKRVAFPELPQPKPPSQFPGRQEWSEFKTSTKVYWDSMSVGYRNEVQLAFNWELASSPGAAQEIVSSFDEDMHTMDTFWASYMATC